MFVAMLLIFEHGLTYASNWY